MIGAPALEPPWLERWFQGYPETVFVEGCEKNGLFSLECRQNLGADKTVRAPEATAPSVAPPNGGRSYMPKPPSILVGVAGEYFVAGELSRRGYIASITLRNSKGVDILVSNQEATRQVGIQVKTNRHDKPEWILNEKAESYYADNLFYVFVNLKGERLRPDCYVVPSKVVAEYTRSTHKAWLKAPGKKGQRHKDSSIRNFRDPEGKYLDRWELLAI
jgi:hypothetical protein